MSLAKILRYVLLGGIFLTPFITLAVFNGFFFPFITPKAFVFRILTEILLAVWLVLLLFERRYRPRLTLILSAVLALVVILTLATIFSVNPSRSFWSNFERMDGLVNYLHLLVYFLIISSVLKTEKQWRAFFNTSIGVSLVVAGYSLLQLAGKLAISQGGARVDATLGNASYLAVYMLFHIFLAAWLWYQNRRPKWLGFVYGPIILLELFVLYHTATRGAILGFIAGLLLTAVLIVLRGREHRIVRRISLAILIIIILTAGSFLILKDSSFIKSSPVLSRFANISLKESTTISRLTVWQMALRGFAERPILGWGPENFLIVFNKYYEPQLYPQEPWFDRSHNIFIDWLVHAGILGFLAYSSLFVVAFYFIWRYGRDPVTKGLFTGLLAAYSIHNFFVFDNLISLLLFFSLLAYFQHLKTPSFSGTAEERQFIPAAVRFGLVPLLIIAAGAAIYWVNIKPAAANRQIIAAFSASSAEERLNSFQRAITPETLGSSEALEQLIRSAYNVVREQAVPLPLKQRYLVVTVTEAEKFSARFPQDARLRLFIGLLFNRLDQPDKAIKYLEEAKELSPRKQVILTELAQAYSSKGEQAKALALTEAAFRSAPAYEETRIIYSTALVLAGRLADAEALWPDGPPPDSRLINAYVKVDRYQEVLALWQKKVKNEPDNVQNRFSLAAAFLTTGNRVQAIAELNEAARLDPRVKDQAEYLINEIKAGRNPLDD